MSEDRRSARRARLSGIRVTYESATGDRRQADVLNLSREGLFVVEARPLAVGKRISLEVVVAGEPGPWAALGRVVWVRERAEGERPVGMAVKFIDVEDSVVSAIEGLIEAREPTERGIGVTPEVEPVMNAPSRERTMLGVGVRAAPVAPVVVPAPGREPTLLGVGRQVGHDREPSVAFEEDREPSLAIDLVSPKSSAPPPAVAAAPVAAAPAAPADLDGNTEPSVARGGRPVASPVHEPTPASEAAPRRKRSGGGWLFLLVLLVGAGALGYACRDCLPPAWHVAYAEVMKLLGR